MDIYTYFSGATLVYIILTSGLLFFPGNTPCFAKKLYLKYIYCLP